VEESPFPDLRDQPQAPEAYLGDALDGWWVLAATVRGFFPWPDGEGQLLWCNPLERMLFDPALWRPPRRLRRMVRQRGWEVRLDGDFAGVLRACQTVGRGEGTWITPQVAEAYQALFQAGVAHCVEVLQGEAVVGGLYGLSLGRAFFGESMFSRKSNGSKVALAVLLAHLEASGFDLFDAQVSNPHLERLGGQTMGRKAYLERLDRCLEAPTQRGPWRLPEGFVQEWAGGSADRKPR